MNNTKKILIVDDSKTVAKVFELKLRAAGFQLTIVNDGYEALEALKNADYDLIVLDLILPRVNGFEVLKRLQETGSKIPVIVTSSLSQQEDLERAKELGAKHFFTKSTTAIAKIVEYVEEILYA